ncbi:hypothetical protein [Ruegeria sp. HKCCA6837]|uniref:hypothetical protein n=1 Tax=Ruegeria sp. HKCCA6837 TaxID=2682989 RepID=UPI0020C3389F|nr:hypothetical protein [Ruegeria sp. HKCCA6837]
MVADWRSLAQEIAGKNMTEISKLTELRKLMQSMERTLGLEKLSPVERDIYYAAEELSKSDQEVRTFGLIEHTLVQSVSRPTFFRALKSLVEKGFLSQSGSANRGRYIVNAPR